MQGQTVVRVGGQDYLVERAFDGSPAVYTAPKYLTISADRHVGGIDNLEPGTRVVILARVATPAGETEEIEEIEKIEIERRYLNERHWEPASWQDAKKILCQSRQELDLMYGDLQRGVPVNTSFCQYRRVASALL